MSQVNDENLRDASVRERLVSVGIERLTDALLQVAEHGGLASDMVERLVASEEQNVLRFERKLADVLSRKRFVGYQEALSFSHELCSLLEDIKASMPDPQKGVEMVAAFFRADRVIFSICDDSSGHIGDVFGHEAKSLLVHYASQCDDKGWVAKTVLGLVLDDEYGVREPLLEMASEYLPEQEIRGMIGALQALAEQKSKDYEVRSLLSRVEILALQIKDAALFEETRRRARPELPHGSYRDIASAYLDAGQPEVALQWLQRMPSDPLSLAWEQDRLLLKIQEKLGHRPRCEEIAWRIFRRHRSAAALNELLRILGEEHREKVIELEAQHILATDRFSTTDALFLVACGKTDFANTYILENAVRLNGDLYGDVSDIAEHMKKAGCHLAATLAYRALLNSILKRAHAKAYRHGVRYLQDLDGLATQISDWNALLPHEKYKATIRDLHHRKFSFWKRYKG